MTLLELHPGQKAVVQSLHTCGPMRRRLRDLGLIEGTALSCLGRSPLGDPSAYLIRGAAIALRGEESRKIEIRLGEA